MKIILVLLFFTVSAYAQDATAVALRACGLRGVQADLTLNKTQHTVAHPEPGKALVYFIQDVGSVTNIGMDGTWAGANKDSYFSVSVAPGKHHLCASVQSSSDKYDRLLQLTHFTAEAGRIYYFRTRFLGGGNGEYISIPALLFLESINSDQGKYLIAVLPRSITHIKKRADIGGVSPADVPEACRRAVKSFSISTRRNSVDVMSAILLFPGRGRGL